MRLRVVAGCGAVTVVTHGTRRSLLVAGCSSATAYRFVIHTAVDTTSSFPYLQLNLVRTRKNLYPRKFKE